LLTAKVRDKAILLLERRALLDGKAPLNAN